MFFSFDVFSCCCLRAATDGQELNAELEALQEESLKTDLLSIKSPLSMPSVPTGHPQAVTEDDEDRELRELAASMMAN